MLVATQLQGEAASWPCCGPPMQVQAVHGMAWHGAPQMPPAWRSRLGNVVPRRCSRR